MTTPKPPTVWVRVTIAGVTTEVTVNGPLVAMPSKGASKP